MTPKEVQKYYGTSYNFNKKTGMSANSFINWLKWGYIPIPTQNKIQKFTHGKLKADVEYIDK